MIADAGRAIGQAVSMLLNVLNPELLVVGGDLAAAGDLLLGRRARVDRARPRCPSAADAAGVVAGVLGERAQVLGAIALVVSRGRSRISDPPRGRGEMNEYPNPKHQEEESMRNRAWQIAAVMAAAGALVFAGCGDDDDERRRQRRLERATAAETRQGRRPAAGLQVVGALGDGRPAVPPAGVRGGRR